MNFFALSAWWFLPFSLSYLLNTVCLTFELFPLFLTSFSKASDEDEISRSCCERCLRIVCGLSAHRTQAWMLTKTPLELKDFSLWHPLIRPKILLPSPSTIRLRRKSAPWALEITRYLSLVLNLNHPTRLRNHPPFSTPSLPTSEHLLSTQSVPCHRPSIGKDSDFFAKYFLLWLVASTDVSKRK
jgi:hypothetical protein